MLLTDKERTPPKSAGRAAKRALEIRANKLPSERCCEATGLARARQLISGKPLSESTIRRMHSFFSRHAVDKKGSTWNDNGKGFQAHLMWGGDSAKRWAASRVKLMESRSKNKNKE